MGALCSKICWRACGKFNTISAYAGIRKRAEERKSGDDKVSGENVKTHKRMC